MDLQSFLLEKSKVLNLRDGQEKLLIEIAELRGDCVEFTKQLSMKDEELKKCEQEKFELIRDNETMAKEFGQLQQKFEEFANEQSRKQTNQEDLSKAFDTMKSEKQMLLTYVNQSVEQKNKNNADLETFKAENSRLKKELDMVTKNNKQLQQENESFKSENEILKNENTEFNTKYSQSEERCRELLEKIEEIEIDKQELHSLQEELLTQLQESKSESSSSRQSEEKIKKKNESLKKEKERNELVITSLQTDLKRIQESSKQEKDSLEKELASREKDINQLTNDMRSTVASLKQEISELQQKNANLLDEVNILKNYSAEAEQFKQKYSKLHNDYQEVRGRADALDKELVVAKQSIQETMEKNNELTKNLSSTLTSLNDVRKEKDASMKERDAKILESNQKDLQLNSLCAMLRHLKQDIEKKKKLLTSNSQANEQIARENEASKKYATVLEEEKQNLLQELKKHEEITETLRQQNKKLEERFQKNREMVEKLEETINKVENDRKVEKRLLGSEIQHLQNVNHKLEKVSFFFFYLFKNFYSTTDFSKIEQNPRQIIYSQSQSQSRIETKRIPD